MNYGRKILSVFLALLLMVGTMPVTAIAEDLGTTPATAEASTESGSVTEPENETSLPPDEEDSPAQQPEEDGEQPSQPAEPSAPSAPAGAELETAVATPFAAAQPGDREYLPENAYGVVFADWVSLDVHNEYRQHETWMEQPWFGMSDHVSFYMNLTLDNWVGVQSIVSLTLQSDSGPAYTLHAGDEGFYSDVWESVEDIPHNSSASMRSSDETEPEYWIRRRHVSVSISGLDLHRLNQGENQFAPGSYRITLLTQTGEQISFHENYFIYDGFTGANYTSSEGYGYGDVFVVPADIRLSSGDAAHSSRWSEGPNQQTVFDADAMIDITFDGMFPPIEPMPWSWEREFELYLIPEGADPYPDGYYDYRIPYNWNGSATSPEHGHAFFHQLRLEEIYEWVGTGRYQVMICGWAPFIGREITVMTEPFTVRKLEELQIVQLPHKLEYRTGEYLDLDGLLVHGLFGQIQEDEQLIEELWEGDGGYTIEPWEYTYYPFTETGSYTLTLRGTGRAENITAEFTVEVINPPINMVETFPDAGLRAAVYAAVGKADGADVFESDLLPLTELDASGRGIESLDGLEALVNLTKLDISRNNLSSINLAGQEKLVEFNCAHNRLATAEDLSLPAGMKSLDCSNNRLTSIGLSGYADLVTLNVSHNSLTVLDLFYNRRLEDLDCSYNSLPYIGFRGGAAGAGYYYPIRRLICNDNGMTSLSTYAFYYGNLQEVDCSNNQISALNLAFSGNLLSLNCANNQLRSLNLSACTKLAELNVSDNQLTALSLSANTALTVLDCSSNELTALDVAANTALRELYCANNFIPGETQVTGHENLALGVFDFEPQQSSAPGAPGAPRVSSRKTSSITLTWDAAEDRYGIELYEIYRDGGKEPVGTATTTSFTDTGLEQNQAYSYTVKAKSVSGAWSEMGEAAELATAELLFYAAGDSPGYTLFDELYYKEAAQSLPITARTQKFSDHDTSAMTAALQYRLAGGDWKELALTRLGVNYSSYQPFEASWNIGELASGTYEVRFLLADGDVSITSPVQTVTIKNDDVAPVITTPQSPEPGSKFGYGSTISTQLRVSDNIRAQKAVLEYSLDGGNTYTEFETCEPELATPSFIHRYDFPTSVLTPGREYTVHVRTTAYDQNGNTAEAVTWFVVDAKAPQPLNPAAYTVTGTNRFIHVSWDYIPVEPDFAAFHVYRALLPGGPYAKVASQRALGYYDDVTKGITAGIDYYYYVTAVDTYGNESEPTPVKSAQLFLDSDAPLLAAFLPRGGDTLCKKAEIVVSATDNYKLKELIIQYRAEGTESWNTLASVPARENSNNEVFRYWWDLSVLPAGNYEVLLSVYDDSGNAPAQKQAAYAVRAYEMPVAPELSATGGHKSVTLNWSYGGNYDLMYNYQLHRSENGGAYRHIKSFGKDTVSYTDTVSNDVAYSYKLVAVDRYDERAESTPVGITTVSSDTEAPVAVIAPDELVAAVGQPFTFSGAKSTDNDRVASHTWDFGDGKPGTGAVVTHTYEQAGTYTVTLTVTDDSMNQSQTTAEIIVHDVTSGESGYTLATFTVVDSSKEGAPPLKGASVHIKLASGEFETVTATGADGVATVLLENGSYSVSVTYGSYLPRTFALDASSVTGTVERTVALSPVSMVAGELTVTEMTQEEIIEAGIDVTDPNNQHVSKVEVVFEFEVGDVVHKLPITYYQNEAQQFISAGGAGGYSGEFVANGELATGEGAGSVNIAVYPVSERFFLVVYGEAHWLKEMYNVQLVVINNSEVEAIEDCTATLDLPDGLSLAGMIDRVQTADIDLGTIGAAGSGENQKAANWYVRGDEEGEYHLSATVSGINALLGDPFEQTFTTDSPLKVYAGSALRLFIRPERHAYRGMPYNVQFELRNVSHKDLYNLSFGITGAEQFQVTTVNGFSTARHWTHEQFGGGATVGVGALSPGESVTINFATPIWFKSIHEVGPASVQYLLKNVFVTTLEGSTTEIPYEIEFLPASRSAVFEAADSEDGEVYVIADDASLECEFAVGETRQYQIRSYTAGGAPSSVILSMENGVFATGAGTLRAGGIEISADTQNYVINEDGTVTITGDALLTVKAVSAGAAGMSIRYNERDSFSVAYTVTGESEAPATVVITKDGAAVTADGIAIPHSGTATAVYSANVLDQNSQPMQLDLVWTNDCTLDGVTVANGAITVDSTAVSGSFTLTATEPQSGLSAAITVEVKALAVDWSGVDAAIAATGYTYGDADGKAQIPATGTATATGTHSGAFAIANPERIQPAGAASVTVTFTVDASDPLYGGISFEKTYDISIAKRAVTVTMDDAVRAYGETNPDFTFTLTEGALVQGDSDTTLGIAPVCAADESSPAGTPVEITAEAGSNNYDVTVIPGELAIERAVLSADAFSDGSVAVSKVYDATTAASVSGELAVAGANGEEFPLPVASVGDYPAANAGTYTVQLTLGELDNANYVFAEDITAYEFTGAEITPADYTFDVAEAQAIQTGNGLAALAYPESGSGVNGEAVTGGFVWYTDESRTTVAGDSSLTGASVTLYWSFTSADSNYAAEPKTGAVTVTIQGMQAPVLASIAVTAKPSKTSYKTGETLDLSGLEVTATYRDGSAKTVTDYTVSPKDGSKLSTSGAKTVTVTYKEGDVQKTATFTVSVKAASVSQVIRETVTKVVETVNKVVDAISSWIRKWF